MNLYFLVEGSETEPKVYDAWIRHAYPHLRRVQTIGEMTADRFYIISGQGYPQTLERIRASLLDIRDQPAVDHFFVCIDAEEDSFESKYREIEGAIHRYEAETAVRAKNPSFTAHVIVQNRCIETWFLGHARMMKVNPSSPSLARYKSFHDVRTQCPEQMGRPAGFLTTAAFHLEYLKEMLREHNSPDVKYTKRNPGIVLEKHYLDALRERCTSTGQLPSLARLLSAWDGIGAAT